MTILGVILLIVGLVLAIKILWIIGLILIAVGLAFLVTSQTHRTSRHYW